METISGKALDREREINTNQSVVLLKQKELKQNGKTPEQPGKKLPKKILLVAAALGVITSGAIFGDRWWHYASTHETTDNAYVTGHVHQISSRISGTVTKVEVDDNEQVKPGELLVRLDPRDLRVAFSKAQAALSTAEGQAQAAKANIALASETTKSKSTAAAGNISDATANIATAKATVFDAQAGISSAQAQVAEANANLTKAQQDYNRYSSLYQQGATTRQQLDDAQATYEVAQAQKNAAQQGVEQAQAKLSEAQQGVISANAKLVATRSQLQEVSASDQQTEVNRAQYAAAQDKIAQSQSALEDAHLQLSYTNITAPTFGKVGSKSVEVGQRVQSGTPLMAIVGNDYWITANFKETQLGKIKPGAKVEVKIDAFGDRTFTGRVNSIAPGSGAEFALLPPDNATGNFTKVVQRIPVKIVLDPQSIQGYESRIVPGMSTVVTVETP